MSVWLLSGSNYDCYSFRGGFLWVMRSWLFLLLLYLAQGHDLAMKLCMLEWSGSLLCGAFMFLIVFMCLYRFPLVSIQQFKNIKFAYWVCVYVHHAMDLYFVQDAFVFFFFFFLCQLKYFEELQRLLVRFVKSFGSNHPHIKWMRAAVTWLVENWPCDRKVRWTCVLNFAS